MSIRPLRPNALPRKDETALAGQSARAGNAYLYDGSTVYAPGAPHLMHPSLQMLQASLIERTFRAARLSVPQPRVLDLGAGDGSVTLPFLELGANVVAVDASAVQLTALEATCSAFTDTLETRQADIHDFVSQARSEEQSFDVLVLSAFLHHIPDYTGLLTQALALLRPRSTVLTFQDPMSYDRLPLFSRALGVLAYAGWRFRQPDVIAGVGRRLRRSCGVYRDACPHDNAEYHVLRGGVDEERVGRVLAEHGFNCTLIKYFSTQSAFFQRTGERLGVVNTFGFVAQR